MTSSRLSSNFVCQKYWQSPHLGLMLNSTPKAYELKSTKWLLMNVRATSSRHCEWGMCGHGQGVHGPLTHKASSNGAIVMQWHRRAGSIDNMATEQACNDTLQAIGCSSSVERAKGLHQARTHQIKQRVSKFVSTWHDLGTARLTWRSTWMIC